MDAGRGALARAELEFAVADRGWFRRGISEPEPRERCYLSSSSTASASSVLVAVT